MNDQKFQFRLKRVPPSLGLRRCARHRDGQVAKVAWLFRREREHVGSGVESHELAVESPQRRITCQADGERAGRGPLVGERRARCPAYCLCFHAPRLPRIG
ncbi:MAG: hypothetical protein RMK99_09770 [Anaerolineales bacterium]|nr:hypothetical protein [Anaerolineales bacterium]